MPVHSHLTRSSLPTHQLHCSDTLLSRLPSDFDHQARLHRGFIRSRALASPLDLLRALLLISLDDLSFRALGVWAVLSDVGDLSDTAWRHRLQRASPFLLWLLGQLLACSCSLASELHERAGRVLLVDASYLRCHSGSGDDLRLHLAFDLLAGRMVQVDITDRSGAEHLSRFAFRQADILVADSGYGFRQQLFEATRQGAQAVVRVHLPTFPLQDEHAAAFDSLGWLKRQHASVVEHHAWYALDGQRLPVRIVASRLPPEKRAEQTARKRRKASKAGRRVTGDTLMLAGWLVVVTTLGAEWSASEVLRLYRARWQIEVLFKRLKQHLKLKRLSGRTQETRTAQVRAMVVAWVLVEITEEELRSLLPDGQHDPHAPASSWMMSLVSVQTLRAEVRGWWTLARVKECLPRLERYLFSHRRGRRQQEEHVRAWLETKLGGMIHHAQAA
ncbi:MAG TPA: transposase [Roseiflexaceae bacterium]|nr:transposase [Roseiflexaceae bacterium]